ncbi:MAG: hypothetical protein ACREJ5_03580 [Geminicoccaceae bacterium]
MTRHRRSRRAAAVLALGLATAAGARPGAAQSEAHGVFHPHVRAVIQAYYPAPQDPSVLDWAEGIVLWNALEVLALQGILDIGALVATCAGPDASDRSGLATCHSEAASLAFRSQVLALEEACPVDLSAGERASCLFAFYQVLASREQMLHAKYQRFLLELSDLGRVYASHGRPEVMRLRAIPQLRRLAELDTILLFASHVRVQALEEQIALLQRIERELAGQAWASEVPRGGLFLTAPRMQRDWTRRQLEWLWTYRSYSLASAGWAEPFREWLELTRHGRISSAPLRLSRLQRRAAFPRPPAIPTATVPGDALRRPPSARPPNGPPGTVPRGLYLVLAQDSVVASDRRPTLWVRGGQPVFLERRDAQQTDTERDGNPNPDNEEGPGTEEGPGDNGGEGPGSDIEEDPGNDGGEGPGSDGDEDDRPPGLPGVARAAFDCLLGWPKVLSAAVDRWSGQRASARRSAHAMQAIGAVLDAAEVGEAMARQDVVGSYVATLKLVGGPCGAVVMELTGFEEKLRSLEDAGYSVPGVMDYAVEVAEGLVSPFSFGRPAPYSQIVVGPGVAQPKLEADIRNYQQRLREAIEDERRRSQPRRFRLPWQ